MRYLSHLTAAALLGLSSCSSTHLGQGHGAMAAPEALKGPSSATLGHSIDSIMEATYAVISGAQDEPRDWDRFRSLFHPDGAKLTAVARGPEGQLRTQTMTPEDYVQMGTAIFKTTGFFEREVARRVETFGAIAHVFSTYESRKNPGDEPFERGVNSFQLVFDGNRWYVTSILWDRESDVQPIPERYAPPE